MAKWSEKISKVTQTAISKSKEMAEITHLNMEISTYSQNIKELNEKIGEYVIENDLLTEDEKVMEFRQKIMSMKASIETNEEKINDIRNINICSECGGEISRNSKFCDKCGVEIIRPAIDKVEVVENVCVNCGEPLSEGAVFCGSCGSKQEQE